MLSERQREHLAMHELLRKVNASDHLDIAVRRFAAEIDPIDTDESVERLQSAAGAAILSALVHVARRQGWRVPPS